MKVCGLDELSFAEWSFFGESADASRRSFGRLLHVRIHGERGLATSGQLTFKRRRFQRHHTFVVLDVLPQIGVLTNLIIELGDLGGQPAPARCNCTAVFRIFVGCTFTSAKASVKKEKNEKS